MSYDSAIRIYDILMLSVDVHRKRFLRGITLIIILKNLGQSMKKQTCDFFIEVSLEKQINFFVNIRFEVIVFEGMEMRVSWGS
jgi:hypothetical protein